MTLMSTQKIRRNRMAVIILEMTQKMRMNVVIGCYLMSTTALMWCSISFS